MKRIILTGRNADFPTFPPPRKTSQGRGHLARSAPSLVERAPSFDATQDVWITPPSRMTRDAGAAADLRHTQAAHTLSFPTLKSRPLADPPRASGHLREVLEFVLMLLALSSFAALSTLIWAVAS